MFALYMFKQFTEDAVSAVIQDLYFLGCQESSQRKKIDTNTYI